MALSNATFSDIGGAASDLFAGVAATTQAGLKAQGLNLQADSTRLNAQGLRIKATGDLAEASNYDIAGDLAGQNEQFSKTSTAIQQMQQLRSTEAQVGTQEADIGASGGGRSGSALDILRDSASQGALAKAVLGQQGFITQAGYAEQQESYQTMASTARTTAAGEDSIADQTDVIANQTDQLAQETIAAGKQAATGDFISSAIKGVAAVASVALAPATGGLSLGGLGGLFMGGGSPSGYK